MNASAYMEHIKYIKHNIDLIELELDKIDKEMITVPALNYNADKAQTSPKKDRLEKLVIALIDRKEDLTTELMELKKDYITEVHEAMKLIRSIDSEDQQEILILRYINNRKWWDILRIRDCDSLSSQQRLKARALEALQVEMDKKKNNPRGSVMDT